MRTPPHELIESSARWRPVTSTSSRCADLDRRDIRAYLPRARKHAGLRRPRVASADVCHACQGSERVDGRASFPAVMLQQPRPWVVNSLNNQTSRDRRIP